MSAKELVESIKKQGEDKYTSIEIENDDDGNEIIIMKLTEDQQEYWIEKSHSLLQQVSDEYKKVDDRGYFNYNDDYTEQDMYIPLDLNVEYVIKLLRGSVSYCGMIQIFTQADVNYEWYVKTNIYNVDTGKLITTGDTETGTRYTHEDVENSK